MTTNYIKRLDEALIRFGRVDKKVELGLADKKMTVEIFRLIFKPVEGDAGPPEDTQSDGLVGEDERVSEAAWSQNEEVGVERLAEQLAAKMPELEFSLAEIQSFLLAHKHSPGMAVANVNQWMTKTVEERRKAKSMYLANLTFFAFPLCWALAGRCQGLPGSPLLGKILHRLDCCSSEMEKANVIKW